MELAFIIVSAAIMGVRLYAWLFIDPISRVDDSAYRAPLGLDHSRGKVKD